MSRHQRPIEGNSSNRLILPSLVLASSSTEPPGIITGLLMVDIGLTFGSPVGITGQVRTISSIIAVIVALLMGVLSVRFKYKSLLLTGLIFLSVSAIGCYLAQHFGTLILSYSLTGIGVSLLSPMISTLIGEHFPVEKRSNAIGWTMAGTSIAYLIGSPAVSYISVTSGWRMAFLGIMLPVSIISLALAVHALPSRQDVIAESRAQIDLFEGFRNVISSRPASACLVGTVFAAAAWVGGLTYSISFFRQEFSMPVAWASILLSGMALSKTMSHLSAGYFINRYGRKNVTTISVLLVGLVTVAYLNLDFMWLSILMACLSCFFAGYMDTSMRSLSLEQIPHYRGPMMSLSSAAYRIGSTIGAGVGGFAILIYGYEVMGATLGILGVTGSIIYHLLTIDPTLLDPARN